MKRVTCFCIMFVFFVTLMISPALALNSSICTETTANATRSAASLNAQWDVEILNNGNLTYCNHTCSHNTTLAIVA